jgi:hypothetical protein
MKFSKPICLLAITLLSSTSYNGYAQENDKDKNRAQQAEREHQVSQGMDRFRDREIDKDRDRDRDRVNDGMGGEIRGAEFMTTHEQERYKDRLQAVNSEQERSEIREQHKKEMKSRNRNRKQYEDGTGGLIYGGWHMTEQERKSYREQLETATSVEQRNEIRMKHQKQIHLSEQANQN